MLQESPRELSFRATVEKLTSRSSPRGSTSQSKWRARLATEKDHRKAAPFGISSIRQAMGTGYHDSNPRAKIHGHFVIV